MAAQWSQLYRESLELILEKLNLADHARFASVCSSWRSVAVENPPINKPLYFALSHDPNHLVRRFIRSFIPSWKTAKFIGSGLDGWLVILIDGRDLFLLNKGFNSIIPLPHLPQDPMNLLKNPHLYKAVLSSSSSSVECTVVINHGYAGVFYCRLGSDKSFTKLSNIPFTPKDILFYEGRLYVLCGTNTIVILDHLLNKVSQLVISFTYRGAPRRLFISGNNIPSVVNGWPSKYYVFTLEGSKPRMLPLNNIGDDDNFFQILLCNPYYNLSITAKEHKKFQRTNCFQDRFGINSVLDSSKDPNKAKVDNPWPLFYVMFSYNGIKNLVKYIP